jgi:hypothetical protein
MLFAVVASFAWSAPVWACAVCGFGEKDPAANAFFVSTVLLSIVPVSIMGGTLYYIYRSVRKANAAKREPTP